MNIATTTTTTTGPSGHRQSLPYTSSATTDSTAANTSTTTAAAAAAATAASSSPSPLSAVRAFYFLPKTTGNVKFMIKAAMATAAVCVYIAALVLCQNVHGYPNLKVTNDARSERLAQPTIILAAVHASPSAWATTNYEHVYYRFGDGGGGIFGQSSTRACKFTRNLSGYVAKTYKLTRSVRAVHIKCLRRLCFMRSARRHVWGSWRFGCSARRSSCCFVRRKLCGVMSSISGKRRRRR